MGSNVAIERRTRHDFPNAIRDQLSRILEFNIRPIEQLGQFLRFTVETTLEVRRRR